MSMGVAIVEGSGSSLDRTRRANKTLAMMMLAMSMCVCEERETTIVEEVRRPLRFVICSRFCVWDTRNVKLVLVVDSSKKLDVHFE